MMALSTRNDDPKTVSRPFDKNRDGLVMGEGGVSYFRGIRHFKKRGGKNLHRNSWRRTYGRRTTLQLPHPEGLGAKM